MENENLFDCNEDRIKVMKILSEVFPCVTTQLLLHNDWRSDYQVTLQREDFKAISVSVPQDVLLMEPGNLSANDVRMNVMRVIFVRKNTLDIVDSIAEGDIKKHEGMLRQLAVKLVTLSADQLSEEFTRCAADVLKLKQLMSIKTGAFETVERYFTQMVDKGGNIV